MRTCILLTALLLSLPLAAEVYRWVDEEGRVHYTDKPPQPGAEPAELPDLQTVPPRRIVPPASSRSERKADAEAVPDYTIRVTHPPNDHVDRSTSTQATVSVVIEPALAAGHGLRYYLDGSPVNAEPTRAASQLLSPVYRGSHTVNVDIVDSAGRILASSGSSTFHKLPPTVKRNAP